MTPSAYMLSSGNLLPVKEGGYDKVVYFSIFEKQGHNKIKCVHA